MRTKTNISFFHLTSVYAKYLPTHKTYIGIINMHTSMRLVNVNQRSG